VGRIPDPGPLWPAGRNGPKPTMAQLAKAEAHQTRHARGCGTPARGRDGASLIHMRHAEVDSGPNLFCIFRTQEGHRGGGEMGLTDAVAASVLPKPRKRSGGVRGTRGAAPPAKKVARGRCSPVAGGVNGSSSECGVSSDSPCMAPR
jgi:hypothetical protein